MIIVKNRTMVIPKIDRTLGTFQDTNTESRLFKIDRFTEGTADLSHLLFKLISRNENGVENPIHLEKAVTNDAIYLTWQVQSNDIGVSGTLLCQIQGFDDQGICRWNSFIGAFYVEQNLGGEIDPKHLSDYEALQMRLEKALQEIENAEYMKKEDLPIASKDIAGMVKIGYGLAIDPDGTVYVIASGGGTGVSSYLALTDKPTIEGVVLSGNKTLEELGIQPAGDYLTPDNAPVGGYYIPYVLEDGTLAWVKTKEEMEDVPGVNIMGPVGPQGPEGAKGSTGKTAFEYAVDGGYTGTEEEFAAKLAEEAVLKKNIISSYEEIMEVEDNGFVADAKATKEGFDYLNAKIEEKASLKMVLDHKGASGDSESFSLTHRIEEDGIYCIIASTQKNSENYADHIIKVNDVEFKKITTAPAHLNGLIVAYAELKANDVVSVICSKYCNNASYVQIIKQ